MKKRIAIVCSIMTFVLLCVIVCNDNLHCNTYIDTAIHADNQEFNYNELKNSSSVIALVEVIDDLKPDNSNVITIDNENLPVVGYYAERSVKVVKFYKGSNYDTNLTVLEPAAIYNNLYLHDEGYESLIKGEKYVLFMNESNASGQLSIISADNGAFAADKLNTREILTMEHGEVAMKFLIANASNLKTNEKKIYLDNDISSAKEFSTLLGDEIIFNTSSGDIFVKLD